MCALTLIGLFLCLLSHNKACHPLSPKSQHRSLMPDSQSTTVPTRVAHLNSPLFRLSGTFVRQRRSEVKDRAANLYSVQDVSTRGSGGFDSTCVPKFVSRIKLGFIE